jgi:expansin (peptidoglycan-binding protein)
MRVGRLTIGFLVCVGYLLAGCSTRTGTSPPPGHASDGSVSIAGTCTSNPTTHTGEGTYYTFADGSGNCMFPATPDDLDIGAMNHADYAGSAACGMCAHVVGAKGELVIRIVDQCPECPAGNIDFSPSAFAKLDDIAKGRIPIVWTYVPCAVSGPIVYHFKDGSNPWWTAVQIRNHRYGIAKLEYQDAGAWVEVPRLDYNYFVADGGMGEGPYSFRVTDVNGAVLEDSGVPLVVDGDSIGTHQFPDCSTP